MTNINMKSKVCTLANSFIRKGYTKSAAFTKAWALVKAEAISDRMHTLSLSTDRYNAAQREESNRLSSEYAILMNRANSIQTAEEAAAIEAKRQKAIADYERKQDLLYEIGCLARKGLFSSDRYKEVRAELESIAA